MALSNEEMYRGIIYERANNMTMEFIALKIAMKQYEVNESDGLLMEKIETALFQLKLNQLEE